MLVLSRQDRTPAMSSRRTQPSVNADADRLRAELEALKATQTAAETAGAAAEEGLPSSTLCFDQLSATEQSAASLGVHPDSWKPIKCVVPPYGPPCPRHVHSLRAVSAGS